MALRPGAPARAVLLPVLAALLLAACGEQRPQLQTSPLLQALQRKVGRIGFVGPDGNIYSIDQSGGGQTALTQDAGANRAARTAVAYRASCRNSEAYEEAGGRENRRADFVP